MGKGFKRAAKKSLEEKVQADYPEFVEEVQGLSVDQMETRLSNLAKNAEDVSDAKQNDEELKDARSKVSNLDAPYRDAKKAIRMKSRYIIKLIREKGGK